MEVKTFNELQSQIQALYQDGDYASALDLATRQFESFPEQAHLLYYWRFSMLARLGETDQAIDLLREVLGTGFWYGEVLLRKSPALQPLQGLPEFERLVDLNRRLREADEARSFPLIVLRSQGRCQAGDPPCPVMLALHANASMAQESVDFWRPAASAGWLVAVPQSSQPMWKGAYVWDDRQITEQEIKKRYAGLKGKYATDPQQVVLAGHSSGGEAAIWLALSGAIPASGFVVFGPAGPLMDEPESWERLIRDHHNPGLRGYMIVGEEDSAISLDNVEILVDMLNEGGIACELEVVPHAGHDYAPEYESSLLRGLEFISQA
jgi:predicted esterase